MGFYIEVPGNHAKAGQLVKQHNARHFTGTIEDVPEGKTLVCVVQNGPFDAVGICYDRQEYEAFTVPDDPRPKAWLLLDTKVAAQLCPKYKQYLAS